MRCVLFWDAPTRKLISDVSFLKDNSILIFGKQLAVGPTFDDAALLFSLHGSQCLLKVRVQGLRRRPAEPLSLLFLTYPVGRPLKQAGVSWAAGSLRAFPASFCSPARNSASFIS